MAGKAALLIVDVQNDFCPGGALQVREGDHVVEPINCAVQLFASARLPVLASRDWHPPTTAHFKEFGGPWPVHCIRDTPGAAFHSGLRLPADTLILSKGADPAREGYSVFEGVDDDGRFLEMALTDLGVTQLFICGLATDYCVFKTACDALSRGIAVTVLIDAVAGVDLVPGDSTRALDEMKRQGARLATVGEIQAITGYNFTT